MSYINGPKITTDSLALCLDAANSKSYPRSGTTWGDLSRNGNDATLTNGPTFNSANGGSIVFDGVNDYATVPSTNGPIAFGTNPFTLEMWIYPTTVSKRVGLITAPGVNGNGPIFAADINASIGLGVVGSADTINTGASAIAANNWYHVVLSRVSTSSNSSFIYINGNLKATGTVSTNFSSTFAAGIGYTSNFSEYFVGNIALVRIYKGYSLSKNEATLNYNATKKRYGL